MSPEDLERLGLSDSKKVSIKNETGQMEGRVLAFSVKSGNIVMYFPEANVLAPRTCDKQSRTPAFKSIPVEITKIK
jgi:anaerobic selenocysteine-containing dehydrogenase|tara:strand:+ start:298 stop:525 length:228 start_codon:yes stop_codon:yes gene_type:complete